MRCNCNFFNRKKNVETIQIEETKLARVLNTFDLSVLGKKNKNNRFINKFIGLLKELVVHLEAVFMF